MNSAGDICRLGEPVLRKDELPYVPFDFPITASHFLPAPHEVAEVGCLDVLHRRRTRREFKPLDESQLSALLWFSAKTLYSSVEPSGFLWSHRPAPSGGGRHPIHLLVLSANAGSFEVSLYEPQAHLLLTLDTKHCDSDTQIFLAGIEAIVEPQEGAILWFVADYLRTLSRYEHGESLVWRDAGALLGLISVAAEALQLNCCAYGVTGEDWVSAIFPDKRFGGVGGCVVGSR